MNSARGKGEHVREIPLTVWVMALLLLLARGPAVGQRVREMDATSLGGSVPLGQSWVAAPGDNPAWEQPAFDDRGWRVLQPLEPLSRQGFAGAQSIWFRAHVRLRPDGPPAALYVERLGFNYSVFANGQLIGQQGSTAPKAVMTDHTPQGFTIPPELVRKAGGKLVLALHVAGGRIGFLDLSPVQPDTTLELVSPDSIAVKQSYRRAHDWSEGFAIMGLNLLVGLCGLVIWWSLREQSEYLALTVWLFANVATILIEFRAHLHLASSLSFLVWLQIAVQALSSIGELEFMRLILKRPRSASWILLEAAVVAINLSDPLLDLGILPLSFGLGETLIRPMLTEVFVLLLLFRAAWRGNRDAALLLLPMFLWSFTDLYRFFRILSWLAIHKMAPNITTAAVLHIFSYSVTLSTIADALGLFSLIMIILRRTVRLSREKADLAAEVAAAEELQLLLMARASRPMPGFRVQTEYRPMQQVGGDFFLVQPCEEDNSLVVVVGDVSGKGLQAAMRVSMILGVLQRDVMGYPDRVLGKLNAALLDQGDLGFTTACCVRLEADGSFCFANAGHLNPYLDGEELGSEGALPLGMDALARYSVLRGRLLPGQRMVLLSDGVLEARSRKGELFGFERTRDLVGMEASAIADVAQRFGQEDDITVLSLALA